MVRNLAIKSSCYLTEELAKWPHASYVQKKFKLIMKKLACHQGGGEGREEMTHFSQYDTTWVYKMVFDESLTYKVYKWDGCCTNKYDCMKFVGTMTPAPTPGFSRKECISSTCTLYTQKFICFHPSSNTCHLARNTQYFNIPPTMYQ